MPGGLAFLHRLLLIKGGGGARGSNFDLLLYLPIKCILPCYTTSRWFSHQPQPLDSGFQPLRNQSLLYVTYSLWPSTDAQNQLGGIYFKFFPPLLLSHSENVCVYKSFFLYFIRQSLKKNPYYFICMGVMPVGMSVNHTFV